MSVQGIAIHIHPLRFRPSFIEQIADNFIFDEIQLLIGARP